MSIFTTYSSSISTNSISPNDRVPSVCIEKISIVFFSILSAGAIIAGVTLYFLHPSWMELSYYAIFGGIASFSAGVVVIAVDKLRGKNEEMPQKAPVTLLPVAAPIPLVKEEKMEAIQETDNVPTFIEEKEIMPQLATDDTASKFIGWLLLSKKPSPSINIDAKTKELIEALNKKSPSLLYEPEFYWLNPHASEKIQISEALKEMYVTLAHEMKTHWKECSKGYPDGTVEQAFKELIAIPMSQGRTPLTILKEASTWLKLAPFFSRLFILLGNKRSAILPWLKDHLTDLLKARYVIIENPVGSRWKERTSFVFSTLFHFLLPFNSLASSENFSGKPFFIHTFHRLVFHLIPDLFQRENDQFVKSLKKAKKNTKKELENVKELRKIITNSKSSHIDNFRNSLELWEKRVKDSQDDEIGKALYFQNEVTQRIVLPFLSKDVIARHEDLKEFIAELNEMEAKFATFQSYEEMTLYFGKIKKEEKFYATTYQDLLAFQPTIQGIFNELIQLKAPIQLSGKKADALSTLKQAGVAVADHLKTLLPSMSIGEFISKSYLIAHEIPDFFKTPDEKITEMKRWLTFFKDFLEAADASKTVIKKFVEYGEKRVQKLSSEISQLSAEQIETRKLLPIQDGFLAFLLLLFSFKNIDKALPVIQEHGNILIELLEESKVPEYVKMVPAFKEAYKQICRWGGLLKKILNNSFPGRSAALEQLVGTIFSEIKKDENRKEEKDFFDLCDYFLEPVAFKLLAGAYMKKSKAAEAFNQLEEKLTSFIKNLYVFNVNEAVNNPVIFKQNLRKKFTSPLNFK